MMTSLVSCLNFPLKHLPSNQQIYILGLTFPLSKNNLQETVELFQILKNPSVICVGIDSTSSSTISHHLPAKEDTIIHASAKLPLLTTNHASFYDPCLLKYLQDQQSSIFLKTIDIHPQYLTSNVFPDDATKAILDSARSRFKLIPVQSFKTTFMSDALYRFFFWLSFPKRNPFDSSQPEFESLSDHARWLKLWQIFHPTEYQYQIELRNAFMIENIRSIVRKMVLNNHPKGPLVVLVEKSNVFGMVELWEKFVQHEHFKHHASPLEPDVIIRY
jgi:hypothetical protein